MKNILKNLMLVSAMAATLIQPLEAFAQTPAKQIFGKMTLPARAAPSSVGFYSKGCLAGGVAMPVDGPTWQVMRLSRNRRWGHPSLISALEKLSINANRAGWNGLLVGDISQPRGGPMLTGHASHQIGLDADIWLTPMPNRRMSYSERENISAIDSLKRGTNYVDDRRWNQSFENLLRTAANMPGVERLLVHPGIKKKLCETVKGDRSWLQKVRPFYGHNYHFHIRMGCQPGSPGCRPQRDTTPGTGCDSSLDWWFKVALAPKKKDPNAKPQKSKPKREMILSDLPNQCAQIVNAAATPEAQAVYQASSLSGFSAPSIKLPKVNPLAVLASKPIEAKGAKSALSSPAFTNSDPAPAAAIAAEAVISDLGGFPQIKGPLPLPTPRPLQ